jgi:plastocyanin
MFETKLSSTTTKSKNDANDCVDPSHHRGLYGYICSIHYSAGMGWECHDIFCMFICQC